MSNSFSSGDTVSPVEEFCRLSKSKVVEVKLRPYKDRIWDEFISVAFLQSGMKGAFGLDMKSAEDRRKYMVKMKNCLKKLQRNMIMRIMKNRRPMVKT